MGAISKDATTASDAPSMAPLTYDPMLPLSEIADFYGTSDCAPPAEAPRPRPYVWCNSLVTLDGYLSYHEPGDTGVFGVAMKPWYPKLSSVDFRMLHAGWAHSDAILITASELRNEPEAQIRVLFDDLIEYRQTVLGKPAQPCLVILTRTGAIPAEHPVFHPPKDRPTHSQYPILVVTTTAGLAALPRAALAQADNPPTCLALDDPETGGVSFAALFEHLWRNCGVRHVDVGAGGDVIQQLVVGKFIDEMRMTLAAQLAGGISSLGARRPHFFPTRDGKHLFTADTAPHMEIRGVRTAGRRLLFLRMDVKYRH
ncbi:hypothetical protein H9P43_007383 [Blastocladiella emersonii ATCC 22665]|nr:hypothetical protein H9P43_007371 [Blastocladiella emersonii ATCC 22665]KAI9173252.1 hypothetical protein H9P43_007383 [Blastocladiella emersonii ATCC 22665]